MKHLEIYHSAASFSDSKPHFQLLDAMRGVAALIVICYHVFEGFATSPFDQTINHGHLAVDFFFILSGFVISYAYDDRWGKMSKRDFFRRRLIRLHPMVVMGILIGVVTYLIQGSVKWDGTAVPFLFVLMAFGLHLFMLPVFPGMRAEIRGNGEMFPINGPHWSLFFEYIGNILYALFIHKLSTKILRILVIVLGLGLAVYGITGQSGFGHLGVGWTMADSNFLGGFLRMAFSYTMGMLIARTFKPKPVQGAFWISALILVALLVVPYIGNEKTMWLNGLYESFCVICVFPMLVYLTASSKPSNSKACKLLGDISYPLYAIHYPFMYLFFAWIWREELTFGQVWPVALGIVVGCIGLAWICLRFYDIPVRRWLSKKL